MMIWQTADTPPEDGQHVLVTDGNMIFLAYRDCGYWKEGWSGELMQTEWGHWMSLPDPPGKAQ